MMNESIYYYYVLYISLFAYQNVKYMQLQKFFVFVFKPPVTP